MLSIEEVKLNIITGDIKLVSYSSAVVKLVFIATEKVKMYTRRYK